MLEPEKNNDFEHKNAILAPVRTAWLGILNTFRTNYYYNIIELASQINSLKANLELAP